MTFDDQHLIIGVKLLTMHGAELELRAGYDWRLAVWNEDDSPESGQEIGTGSLLARDDKDCWRTECLGC